MNFFELVFSDNRSIRFRRHLLFWSAWFIYMVATYLIPTNWIPGWNIRGPMPHIEKYGITLALPRILMAGLLLTVVHMALVYGILYYFLPRYLSKSRQRVFTTLLLILFVCVIAFINYFNFVLSMYISTRIGYFETMPGMEFIVPLWARQILFNYPTIVGFALAIKLLKNWYLKQSEVAHATREKINAELQLLKAQVHPHFLFNTLNNIYSFIINDSPAAPDAIKKLSTLLRYFIYECNQPLVKLEKELRMIRGYIDLEKIRYGQNFNLKLQFKGNAHDHMISPLLLIPFLENSFKHARGDVRCGAEAADAQGFALEIFQCFELRLSDQRHRPVVEKAGDDSHRQAGNGGADDGAEQLTVVDVSCRQGGDRDVGIHPNDLGFESLVFEQPVFLRHRDRQVRHIRIGHRDANPVQRLRRRVEEAHEGDQD